MSSFIIEATVVILLLLYRHLNKFWGYLEALSVPMIQENIFSVHKLVFPKFDQACLKKYGKIWTKYEGFVPHIFVADPDLLKEIMIKNFDCFMDRQHFPIGEKLCSLITSRSDAWHAMRKLISPLFTTAKVKPMLGSLTAVTDEFIENVEKKRKQGQDDTVDFKPLLQYLSLDAVASCAFGIEGNSFQKPESDLYKRCCRLFSDFRLRSFGESIAFYICSRIPILLKIVDFIGMSNFEYLFNFTKNIGYNRQKTRGDFIDKLNETQLKNLECKGELNENQIYAQGIGIIQAAFETTSNTMGTLLHMLAKHPEVQSKLFEEIQDVFGDENVDEAVTMDKLTQLTYMNAVIFENLRINPPVCRLDRTCIKDCKIGDIQFKKGTIIQIPVYAIHHHEEFYPEPELFNPDRFLGLSAPPRGDLTYLSFGAGPRYCAGIKFAMAEIKITLLKVLRTFILKDSSKTKLEILGGDLFFLLYPDIHLDLERRPL
ncbi:cytochrome P450 3A24-like [Tigriopus californicus]|uniref:cytochrome P450 3A24-like n=1 Tax=Tigriopus californicus TaxID=6832 RepID=UPI0027DA89A5|nr:cytochrome P450 3A24-like [Tigriopus californicus]|eukprot:TCALIF_05144-PA protein Name:"Similar to CYP3A24 Cytochrome P450 3A24 (Ovis aries)" AED:0.13 eAED:0.14 QI:1/0.25/0/1/1/0.8/5/0/485